jgi:hypothetical protein
MTLRGDDALPARGATPGALGMTLRSDHGTRRPGHCRRVLRPGWGEPGAQGYAGAVLQVAQVVPLTAKLVGTASLVVQVPWKPTEVLPPAAMVAL